MLVRVQSLVAGPGGSPQNERTPKHPLPLPNTACGAAPGMLKQLQAEFSSFVWAGKKPRMNRDMSFRSPDKGGLGMTNLDYYYQATQIRCLLEWA